MRRLTAISFQFHYPKIENMPPPSFDGEEAIVEFKESLIEKFCFGEACSSTVAFIFDSSPILKVA